MQNRSKQSRRDRTLRDQIRLGNVMPVISQQVMIDRLLDGYEGFVKRYAEYIDYPLEDKDNLLRMIKFYSVEEELSELALKVEYLRFQKHHLLEMVREASGDESEELANAQEEMDKPDETVSKFAGSLGYPSFGEDDDNPFRILANLPLPIYLTTSQHTFLEDALIRIAEKQPRTEFCRWNEDSREIPPKLDDPYDLDKMRPIVFHLFGIDEHAESLVLTEDDYLQWLVSISRDGEPDDPIPGVIRSKFSSWFTIFLGFDLPSWDFRALFWGLIKPGLSKRTKDTDTGMFTLQLKYSKDEELREAEKQYLQKFLDTEARLEVKWQDIEEYALWLRELVQGSNGRV